MLVRILRTISSVNGRVGARSLPAKSHYGFVPSHFSAPSLFCATLTSLARYLHPHQQPCRSLTLRPIAAPLTTTRMPRRSVLFKQTLRASPRVSTRFGSFLRYVYLVVGITLHDSSLAWERNECGAFKRLVLFFLGMSRPMFFLALGTFRV